jgi:hypothetical protein
MQRMEYVLVTWDEKLQAYRTLNPEERTRVGKLEDAAKLFNHEWTRMHTD